MGTDLSEQVHSALTDETIYDIDGKPTTVRDYYKAPNEFDPAGFVDNRATDAPMYWVNWNEASAFCHKLTERERAANRLPAGYVYRLPTEAEWEYACRAGTNTATFAGEIKILGRYNAPALDEIAWYGGNSSVGWTSSGGLNTDSWQEKQYPGGRAAQRSVATRKPNPWGLYDMLGNVWEWCADWYGPQLPGGEVTDPVGPATGKKHVSRGGSWMFAADGSRSAKRFCDEPGARFRCVGFRIALAPQLAQ
jgi:formylglycine-generating enzyme required for sulfatase activity